MTKIPKILEGLIKIHSLSNNVAACQKIISACQKILRQERVLNKLLIIGGTSALIWGETNMRKTRWLINTHLDVVPANNKDFISKTNNGKLWGRGSADAKGNVAILLSNASLWQKISLNKNITFMLVVDEEVGGNSTREIIKSMPLLKGAIFMEPTQEKIVTQAKGIMQIKIETSGKTCHGSRPWQGKNALEIATISLCRFLSKHPIPTRETRKTSYNFSVFNSGNAINQVPDKAMLLCDIRWNPKDSPRDIILELKNVFNRSKISIIKNESPINCLSKADVLNTFIQAVQQNNINPKLAFEHGSSDARHCTAIGIPAIVFGPKGKNLHADNEWVSILSLERVSKILNAWIMMDLDRN